MVRGLAAPLFVMVVGALVGACDAAEGRSDRDGQASGPTYVDSIRPIAEEMRRFRATLDREPGELAGGAGSLDALLEAVVEAVNIGDEEALRALAVDRAEFASFYYPYSAYTHPPYELSPALVWFQLTHRSDRGLTRLLETFQTRQLRARDVRCGGADPAGPAWVHGDCAVEVLDADGEWTRLVLFGRVMERDGRLKILSYANRL